MLCANIVLLGGQCPATVETNQSYNNSLALEIVLIEHGIFHQLD